MIFFINYSKILSTGDFVERVQYVYYYSEKYKVYFVRRLDGEMLDRHVPKGLYSLCYEEFVKNNHLAVAFSSENKVVFFSEDETMALMDFNMRVLDSKEREKMFEFYRNYNLYGDEEPSIADKFKRKLNLK